jgi:hypothetical protein
MKDEGFAEAWDRALAQGYARLEARLLEEAMPSFDRSNTSVDDGPSTIPSSGNGPPPHPAKPDREELEREAEEAFDPELAIILLREHARRLSTGPRQGCGPADKRKNLRTTARVATNEEVRAALVQRLKAFALRQGSGQGVRHAQSARVADEHGAQAAPPSRGKDRPLHHPSDGPPPRDKLREE